MRQHKEINDIQIRKRKEKLSLFTVDMNLYREDSKDSTKTLVGALN